MSRPFPPGPEGSGVSGASGVSGVSVVSGVSGVPPAADVSSAALEVAEVGLGTSGWTIPRVALGCGNFGGIGSHPAFFGQGLSEVQAGAIMDAAWQLGITHFDTADAYGGGRSETAIGRWMACTGAQPTLTTKTFHPMTEGSDRGLAPERIVRQLGGSLERLGVERVQLFLAHDFDPGVPLADSLAAFEALREQESILAYGVSNFSAGQLQQALDAGRPAAVQNSYSLLDAGDAGEVLPLCRARGIAYLAFSPLAGGWLTGKYRRGEAYPAGSRMTRRPEPYRRLAQESTFDALERLLGFARRREISPAGAALAWLLADPRVSQIVVGPGSPEQLQPVREALVHPLDPAARDELAVLLRR